MEARAKFETETAKDIKQVVEESVSDFRELHNLELRGLDGYYLDTPVQELAMP